jgi:hypothetical protein
VKLDLDLLTRAVAKTQRQRPGRGPMDLDDLLASVRTQRQAPRQRSNVSALGEPPLSHLPPESRRRETPPEHRPPSSNFFGWTPPKTKAQQQARERNWLALLEKNEYLREVFEHLRRHGWPEPTRQAMFEARPQDWSIDLEEMLHELVDDERHRRRLIGRIERSEILAGKSASAQKNVQAVRDAKREIARLREKDDSWLESVERFFGKPGLDKMVERLKGEGVWPFADDLPVDGAKR